MEDPRVPRPVWVEVPMRSAAPAPSYASSAKRVALLAGVSESTAARRLRRLIAEGRVRRIQGTLRHHTGTVSVFDLPEETITAMVMGLGERHVDRNRWPLPKYLRGRAGDA